MSHKCSGDSVRLRNRIEELEAENARLQTALAALFLNGDRREVQALRGENAELTAERDALKAENETLRGTLPALCEHEFHQVIHETGLCEAEKAALRTERDALAAKLAALENEIAGAPVVFSRPNFGNNCEVWARKWENGQGDVARRARLVRVEAVPPGETQ